MARVGKTEGLQKNEKNEKKQPSKSGPRPGPGPLVYLGPNLPGGVLSHGQVFLGGLPPAAAEMDPALFVPLAEMPQAKRALADPSSGLARARKILAEGG